MDIHHLATQPSILNTFLSELRNETLQKDRMRFRRNVERIGEIISYELSKSLAFNPTDTRTPLGTKNDQTISNSIVLCAILRAGIPLHQGLLNYFDRADNAFISAYRTPDKSSGSFNIAVDYLAAPNLNNKTLILADPMLATGQSLVAAYEALQAFGLPNHIHIVSVVGAQQGVDFIKTKFPKNTSLWIADIDAELDSKGYIIPGLGDAGDLAYGPKA